MRSTLLVLLVLLVLHIPSSGLPASRAETVLKASVKLSQPKKVSKRTPKPLDRVPVQLWLPEGVKVIRGAVVNPFYLKATEQKHWQAAARQWDFAIVSANYFGVKQQDFPTLLQALQEFARQSGHEEIAHLPLCFVGMSAGAGMSTRFADLIPERVLAVAPVCLEVGPRSAKSQNIPMMTIVGSRDGKQLEKVMSRLPDQRKEGARWAVAVQWGRRHEFARANNLAMPFFDEVIRLRYPKGQTPLKGPVKLLPIPENQGWLGDPESWKGASARVAPFKEYRGDRSKACWFPNRSVARVWQAMVAQRSLVKITTPPGMGDRQPFTLHPKGLPVNVVVRVSRSVKVKELELLVGDTPHGRRTSAGAIELKGLKSGIHPLIAVVTQEDGQRLVSAPNTIIVGNAK